MGILGGVLDLASSIVSSATHGGGSSKMEMTDGGKGVELDAGPLKVSISDQGVSVQLDGKEIAKVGKSSDQREGDKAPPPSLDLHSKDTFEAAKPPAPVAGLFDEKSGIGSKPGGTGEGRA